MPSVNYYFVYYINILFPNFYHTCVINFIAIYIISRHYYIDNY